MDAIVQANVQDRPIAPYQRSKRRTPKKSTRVFSSSCSENFNVMNIYGHGGFLYGRSSLSLSEPRVITLFNQQRMNQPPLLPLPIPNAHQSFSPRRQLSCPPTNSKKLTPKKPKPAKRREDVKVPADSVPEFLVVTSNKRIGPEPKDLPKNVSIVLSSPISIPEIGCDAAATENLKGIPDSVFAVSPPPSSLPLPKFSLRRKLNCKAEATAVDAGATDDLRRMLRLL